mgnify:CR=1 FL=1
MALPTVDLPAPDSPTTPTISPRSIEKDNDFTAACTPCRDGTPWAVEILQRIENGNGTNDDLDSLAKLCDFMWLGKTHCALAPGAVEPMKSALRYFKEDFNQHIEQGCCPYSLHEHGHQHEQIAGKGGL